MSTPAETGNAARRVVRVFVSSTFRDMVAERDLLAKHVFPDLRRRCGARGVDFIEVDLRWGVTEEAAEDGAVLPVCLREIDHCRPYFVAMLGERYGSVLDVGSSDLLGRYPWLEFHRSRSITELEILHGAVLNIATAKRAFFYFRSPAYVDGLPVDRRSDYTVEDADSARKVASLKGRIREAGFPIVEDYPNPEAMAERVHRDLLAAIEADFPDRLDFDPDEADEWRHTAFAAAHLSQFIDTTEAVVSISRHVDAGRHVCVVGPSGSGKSALLANWATRARERMPEAFVFEHYAGCTAPSVDPAAFVMRLIRALDRRFRLHVGDLSSSDDLVRHLATALRKAAAQSPVILVLDALDRLTDRGGVLDLTILPATLPAHVTVVASSTPGRPADAARRLGWAIRELRPLPQDARRQFVVAYLHERYRKALTPRAIRRIADAEQASHPLYLRLLLEELRLFGEYELVDAKLDELLQAGTVAELIDLVITRCESDFDQARLGLVGETLALLWGARRGLTEHDLITLLRTDGRPLPMRYWSSLLLTLKESLVIESDLIALASDTARDVVVRRYLAGPAARKAVHRRLADHFATLEGARRLDELPWQLQHAEAAADLTALLLAPDFLLAMMAAGRLEDLGRYWRFLGAPPQLAKALAASFSALAAGEPAQPLIAHQGTRLGYFLREQGHPIEAEQVLRAALGLAERALGWRHLLTAECARSLGAWLDSPESADERRELLYRALASLQVTVGEDHDLTQGALLSVARSFAESGAATRAEVLLHRVRASFTTRRKTDTLLAVALDNLGDLAEHAGEPAVAERYYREALPVFERECGPFHRDTAVCLDRLSGVLLAQDRVDEAERTSARALEIWRHIRGGDDADAAVSMTLLGRVAIRHGDVARGRELYRRALELRERILGVDHPDTVRNRTALEELAAVDLDVNDAAASLRHGLAAEHAGKYQEAERLFRRAYEWGRGRRSDSGGLDAARAAFRLAERHMCGGRPADARSLYREALDFFEAQSALAFDVAECLFGLADLHVSEGDADAARAACERALAVARQQLGGDTDYMPRAHTRKGAVEAAVGDLEAARQSLALAVRLSEERYPIDDVRRHAPMNNLAMVLAASGDADAAEALHRRVLDDRERLLGSDHPSTAVSMASLADLLTAKGELDDALVLAQRALAVYLRAAGADSRETASAHRLAGVILQKMRRSSEALPHLRSALGVFRATLGDAHPTTWASMASLASALDESGDHAAAEAVLRDRLAAIEQALPPNHPLLSVAVSDLAGVAGRLGKPDEAESLFRRALAIIEVTQGAEHTDTAVCHQQLADQLRRQGKLTDAVFHLARALEIFEKALGLTHVVCGACLDDLGDLYRAKGDVDAAEGAYRRAASVLDIPDPVGRQRLEGVLRALSNLLEQTDRQDEAVTTFARVVALREARSQPSDPLLAFDLLIYVGMLLKVSQREGAGPLAKRAWEILRAARERRDPRAMFAYLHWARVCERVGEHGEAVQHFSTIIELFETCSGDALVTEPTFVAMAATSYERVASLRDIREANWKGAERRLRAALELFTRAGKHADAADAELSLQLVALRSGASTDRHRIEELCARLERSGDSRSIRARALLNELPPPRVNRALFRPRTPGALRDDWTAADGGPDATD